MLCLQLLQLSMVYINTLMLQQVIKESNWLDKMALEETGYNPATTRTPQSIMMQSKGVIDAQLYKSILG
jgi:hypothetical protein